MHPRDMYDLACLGLRPDAGQDVDGISAHYISRSHRGQQRTDWNVTTHSAPLLDPPLPSSPVLFVSL